MEMIAQARRWSTLEAGRVPKPSMRSLIISTLERVAVERGQPDYVARPATLSRDRELHEVVDSLKIMRRSASALGTHDPKNEVIPDPHLSFCSPFEECHFPVAAATASSVPLTILSHTPADYES